MKKAEIIKEHQPNHEKIVKKMSNKKSLKNEKNH